MEDYPIGFIRRTKEILEKNYPHFEENDREVTFLLNCLLGLIVAVREAEVKSKVKVFDGNIDDDFLALVPETIGFVKTTDNDIGKDLTESNVNRVDFPVSHKKDLGNQTKPWLLKMIRHGIAHQNLLPINNDGEWVGVRLWNEPVRKVKDFEIVFMIEELKKFAIGLSSKYLNAKESL